MTLSPWMVYAADVCTSLCVVASIGLFLSGAALFVALVTWPMMYDRVRVIVWTLAAYLTVVIFVPSGKVLAAMYVLPAIVNSAAVQELPAEAVEAARAYIRDLLPKRKEAE
ncbi:MAG: hypothetical protein ACI4SY_02105 [Sutterella sp.]